MLINGNKFPGASDSILPLWTALGIANSLMSDAAQPTRSRKKQPKPFTAEQARDLILAKAEKAGPRGVAALWPAKTASEKAEVLERALTVLERERELFVDRRGPKPKHYVWALRPKLPTRESVAAQIEEYAAILHPTLLTPADLKKAVGKNKDAAALLFSAFEYLTSHRRLIILRQKKGKTLAELYAHAPSLRMMLPAGELAPETEAPTATFVDLEAAVKRAYHALVTRTGFPAVAISTLQREAAVPLDRLKAWLLDRYQAGQAIFSLGDWSLASEEKRAAAIEMHGDRHLLVQLT
jgi:hypothetical protein